MGTLDPQILGSNPSGALGIPLWLLGYLVFRQLRSLWIDPLSDPHTPFDTPSSARVRTRRSVIESDS
jgi:hypothetical protein